MEPVNLKAGTLIEIINFIVAPEKTKTMVLGLAWLRKWNLSIDWDSNKWRMRKKAVSRQESVKVPNSSLEPVVKKVKVESMNTLKESEELKPCSE